MCASGRRRRPLRAYGAEMRRGPLNQTAVQHYTKPGAGGREPKQQRSASGTLGPHLRSGATATSKRRYYTGPPHFRPTQPYTRCVPRAAAALCAHMARRCGGAPSTTTPTPGGRGGRRKKTDGQGPRARLRGFTTERARSLRTAARPARASKALHYGARAEPEDGSAARAFAMACGAASARAAIRARASAETRGRTDAAPTSWM